MNGLKYPLEQLMTIKKNRYDQAVKMLEEKKALLIQEQERLKEEEARRDKVLKHKNDKLTQMREEMDQGTTSDKIKQMKRYLEVVDEDMTKAQKKVDDQTQKVEVAENQVEAARAELFAREKDLEKLKTHKKEWEKEVKYWSEKKEASAQDELGASTFVQRKIKKARENK